MDRVVNRRLAAVGIAFALCGCAAATLQNPDGIGYKSRAVSRSEGGLQVSAAVLSDEESAAVFGVPLAKQGRFSLSGSKCRTTTRPAIS